MAFPIVRLEVEHMKESILMAFTEREASLDEDLRAAVDAYCTPENIRRVIASAVGSTLDIVIREEVERFYRYGAGRRVVAEAVGAKLSEGLAL